jgi:hypothetical protein
MNPYSPGLITVYKPKVIRGSQCFLVKIDEILSIRHSIFDSILGVYLIIIRSNDNDYLVKVGKGRRFSLSNKLDEFIKKIQDISGKKFI